MTCSIDTESWESCLLEAFRKLRNDGKLCDMTLISGESTHFAVHSVILAVASPVIMQLVMSGNTTLSFPEIEADVLAILLDLIYSGKVLRSEPQTDALNPLHFIKSAELLQIHPSLKQELHSWLFGTNNVKIEDQSEQEDDAAIVEPVNENSQKEDDITPEITEEHDDLLSTVNVKEEDNVTEMPPKKDNGKEMSPKEDNCKEMSPKEDNSKVMPPKEDNGKEMSPREDNSKEMSPKKDNGKEMPPKEDNGKEMSPKKDNGKEMSPKEDNGKEMSSKEDNVKEMSPKEDNGKEMPPKENNGKEMSPKEDNVKEMSPKEDNGKDMSSKEDNVKEMSPKDNNGKEPKKDLEIQSTSRRTRKSRKLDTNQIETQTRRPKRKRVAPKELDDFLVEPKVGRKKGKAVKTEVNLENNSPKKDLQGHNKRSEIMEIDNAMDIDQSENEPHTPVNKVDNVLKVAEICGSEVTKSDDNDDDIEIKKDNSENCMENEDITLTLVACIETNTEENTGEIVLGPMEPEHIITESSSHDDDSRLNKEVLEAEAGQCNIKEENETSTPKKMHSISRTVLKKLKMLEKRSKETKRLAGRRTRESKSQDLTAIPVKNGDLIIKCMTCDLQCPAVNVKCLLCFERLPRDSMRKHMAGEHPFYGHVNCWMSCSYRHNAAVIGELKERVIAKKVLTNKDAESEETSLSSTTFQCSLCQTSHKEARGMKEHLVNVHSISKCYICETCGDMFKNPGTRREHKHYCSGGEPMKCDQCFKVLDGPKSLWMHIRAEHTNDKKISNEEVKPLPQLATALSPGMKIAECIKCGPACENNFVKCMLCLCELTKDTFEDHLMSFHQYSPTNHFMFKCVDDLVKEEAGASSKVSDFLIGTRVAGKKEPLNSQSLSSSKYRLKCLLCSEQCTGITLFGKHCRYEHDIKVVFMCKVCKDVFRSASVREKHYKYCGFGHEDSSTAKKGNSVDDATVSAFLALALCTYSSLAPPCTLEDVRDLEHGLIKDNPQQKSRCLKCAKNMHSCMSQFLRCFLCHQHVTAECLDAHLMQQHAHLQGSQCFTCGKRTASSSKDHPVLGFNRIIDSTAAIIGAENIDDQDSAPDGSNMMGNTCLYCGAQYAEFQDFVSHCSSQHGITEMHYCSKCPMIFNTKFSQTEHEFFCDLGGAPFCKQCDQLFASPQMLKKHEREQHSSKAEESQTTVKCPYCDTYEEQGLARYRVHLQTVHNRDKISVCKICFEAFDQGYKKDLHEHEVHGNRKTFCSECDKDFSTPVKLQRHINYWHKGGKHKEMVRRSQASEKICQYCGKGFKVLANMRDHVNRYHLQHKPYQCSYCDKRFYHTFAKQKHEFKDHAAGYYQCSLCTHKAYSNWDLKKHVERVHGPTYTEKNNSRIELKQETISSGQNTEEDQDKDMQRPPLYILEGNFVHKTPNVTNPGDEGQVEENEFRGAEVVDASTLPNVVYQIQDEDGQVYEVKGLGSSEIVQQGECTGEQQMVILLPN